MDTSQGIPEGESHEIFHQQPQRKHPEQHLRLRPGLYLRTRPRMQLPVDSRLPERKVRQQGLTQEDAAIPRSGESEPESDG